MPKFYCLNFAPVYIPVTSRISKYLAVCRSILAQIRWVEYIVPLEMQRILCLPTRKNELIGHEQTLSKCRRSRELVPKVQKGIGAMQSFVILLSYQATVRAEGGRFAIAGVQSTNTLPLVFPFSVTLTL